MRQLFLVFSGLLTVVGISTAAEAQTRNHGDPCQVVLGQPNQPPSCDDIPCNCCNLDRERENPRYIPGTWVACRVNRVRPVEVTQHAPNMMELHWEDTSPGEACSVVFAIPECAFTPGTPNWTEARRVAQVTDGSVNSASFLVPVQTDASGRWLDACGNNQRSSATRTERFRVPDSNWLFAVQERATSSCLAAPGFDASVSLARRARVSVPGHGYNYNPLRNGNQPYAHYNPVRGALLRSEGRSDAPAYEPNVALMLDSMDPTLGRNEQTYLFSGDPNCQSNGRSCIDELRGSPGGGLGISMSNSIANRVIEDQYYDPTTRGVRYLNQPVGETGAYHIDVAVNEINLNPASSFIGLTVSGWVSTERLLQGIGVTNGEYQFGPIRIAVGLEAIPTNGGFGVSYRMRLQLGNLLPAIGGGYELPFNIPPFIGQAVTDFIARKLEEAGVDRDSLNLTLLGRTFTFEGQATLDRVEAWYDPPHVDFAPESMSSGTIRLGLNAHSILYYSLAPCIAMRTQRIGDRVFHYCEQVDRNSLERHEQPVDVPVVVRFRPLIIGSVLLMRFESLEVSNLQLRPPRALVDLLENQAGVSLSNMYLTDRLIAANLRPVQSAWWYVSAEPTGVQMFAGAEAGRSYTFVPVRVRQTGHPISLILEASEGMLGRQRTYRCRHWSNVDHRYQYMLFETDADLWTNYRYADQESPTRKHRDFSYSLAPLTDALTDPLEYSDYYHPSTFATELNGFTDDDPDRACDLSLDTGTNILFARQDPDHRPPTDN